MTKIPHIVVEGLEMRYGEVLIQENLNFTVYRGDIFIIMGGSGCGKTTLLKHMIGLKPPYKGRILFNGVSLWDANPSEKVALLHKMGILYQTGALWNSMTIYENIALTMEIFTKMNPERIRENVSLKLSLVGLAGFEEYYPSEISEGMKKRAGLARALALDPEILFFDEPSSGLDPINAKHFDDLVLALRNSLNSTVIIVTHELESLLSLGTNSVFLDAESKTMIAEGVPRTLLKESENVKVKRFLTRGRERGGDE